MSQILSSFLLSHWMSRCFSFSNSKFDGFIEDFEKRFLVTCFVLLASSVFRTSGGSIWRRCLQFDCRERCYDMSDETLSARRSRRCL